MAAHREQTLGDREVAIAQGPLDHRLGVSSGLSSPHRAMPSSNVPDWFMRGSPRESVASMWKWQ